MQTRLRERLRYQNYGEEGRLCHSWSPASTPRVDVLPEKSSWSLSRPLLRFNVVTLGRTVGLQDCSGETCSLSEETQASYRQEHVPPTTGRDSLRRGNLPHSRRPCKQWGCPLSSPATVCSFVFQLPIYSSVCPMFPAAVSHYSPRSS